MPFKNIVKKLFVPLLAVLPFFCVLANAQQKRQAPAVSTNLVVEQTSDSTPDPDAIVKLLQQKCDAVNAQNMASYKDRFTAYSFCAYPRIFWEDAIAGHRRYAAGNTVFADMAFDAHSQLLDSDKSGDINSLVYDAMSRVILNPRNLDSFKNIPFPSPEDNGYLSFILASAYIQYVDYGSRIDSLSKDYAQYQGYFKKYTGATLEHMTKGYNPDVDFAVINSGVKSAVFYKRARAIADFVNEFTLSTRRFIGSVLVPLQSDIIEGEAADYLNERIDASELPPGVSKQALINVLLEGVPSRSAAYAQARNDNPNFKDKIEALDNISYGIGSFKNNAIKAMGLLDYLAPSYYIERVSEGTMNYDVYIERVTGGIIAASLNRRLTLVASELFEFEKPFYYTTMDIGSASYFVGKHWHAIATNQHYVNYPIAKIASENLLKSGRRQFQDNGLNEAIRTRRYLEGSKQLATYVLYATDQMVSGPKAVKSLVTPLTKGLKTGKAATTAANTTRRVTQTAADTKFNKAVKNVKNATGAVTKTGGDANKIYGGAKLLLPEEDEY